MGFGPLLRMNFKLFARAVDDIKLVFPTGRMVDVKLDNNDILYIYHEPQTNNVSANTVTNKVVSQDVLLALHELFNHASLEKINATLAHTKGIKVTLEKGAAPFFYPACAQGKTKRKGL